MAKVQIDLGFGIGSGELTLGMDQARLHLEEETRGGPSGDRSDLKCLAFVGLGKEGEWTALGACEGEELSNR